MINKFEKIRANKFFTKYHVDQMKEQRILRENAKILNRINDIYNKSSKSAGY